MVQCPSLILENSCPFKYFFCPILSTFSLDSNYVYIILFPIAPQLMGVCSVFCTLFSLWVSLWVISIDLSRIDWFFPWLLRLLMTLLKVFISAATVWFFWFLFFFSISIWFFLLDSTSPRKLLLREVSWGLSPSETWVDETCKRVSTPSMSVSIVIKIM